VNLHPTEASQARDRSPTNADQVGNRGSSFYKPAGSRLTWLTSTRTVMVERSRYLDTARVECSRYLDTVVDAEKPDCSSPALPTHGVTWLLTF